MKYKIVANGKEYKIYEKFLFWWVASPVPPYKTVYECKKAIFTVYGVKPDKVMVEE